jgi:hypothetical protein
MVKDVFPFYRMYFIMGFVAFKYFRSLHQT